MSTMSVHFLHQFGFDSAATSWTAPCGRARRCACSALPSTSTFQCSSRTMCGGCCHSASPRGPCRAWRTPARVRFSRPGPHADRRGTPAPIHSRSRAALPAALQPGLQPHRERLRQAQGSAQEGRRPDPRRPLERRRRRHRSLPASGMRQLLHRRRRWTRVV